MEESRQENEDLEQNNNNSDTAQLISSNTNYTKINVFNIINNILSLLFFSYIVYMSFKHGVLLYSFHPTFTTAGWVLLMTSAIHSISPGDVATQWVPANSRSKRHWILQTCGLICSTSGFIIIVVNKFIENKYHFTTVHSWLGLTAIILSILLSCSGIFALYSNRFSRPITPSTLKIIHTFGGLITFVVGFVAIFFALYAEWDRIQLPVRIVGSIVMSLILFFTLFRSIVNLVIKIKNRSMS